MLFFTQCFGIFTDLVHLRCRHPIKSNRCTFSGTGPVVCVVNPASPHGDSSLRRCSSLSLRTGQVEAKFPRGLSNRPCSCPLHSCDWEGDSEVVGVHLKEIHQVTTLQGQHFVFLAADMNLPEAEDWLTLQCCLGEEFLLVLKKQEKREGFQQYFAVVMLLGPDSAAEKFTYRLELNRDRRRLSWESTVRSISEGINTVIAESDCLVLSEPLARIFSDNGKLGIIISISATKQS
ncbi:seven in absentia homolog 3-like [Polypterus senegalus]|uniref:seven in absentia homolog 3-like n=1 Tax=Polypterus senegalus TaxID=55291 RepID=UPI00196334D7|nr:seven in absentia homolog 3-like [Polypterus senegalus]